MTRERLVVVGERSIKRIGNGPGALYADLTAYRECDRDVTGQSVEELSEFPRPNAAAMRSPQAAESRAALARSHDL